MEMEAYDWFSGDAPTLAGTRLALYRYASTGVSPFSYTNTILIVHDLGY